MRDEPAGVTESELVAALATGWGIEGRSLAYRPVGAGSYHWTAGDRWVTVDRLGSGDSFALLEGALRTAYALRDLDLVVAPLLTATGAPLRRLAGDYAVSVFPVVDGVAGEFGEHPPGDVPAVADVLVALHGATPAAAATAHRTDLLLPGRHHLEEALADLGGTWTAGPYSETARACLSANVLAIRRRLGEFDDLAGEVRAAGTEWVVTHGEPHPGNFLRTPAGLRLIDWDTARIAPPERDLWMVPGAVPRYTSATGRSVTEAGLAFYRLWWTLADIAAYAGDLRRPHGAGGDAAAALTYLTSYFDGGMR